MQIKSVKSEYVRSFDPASGNWDAELLYEVELTDGTCYTTHTWRAEYAKYLDKGTSENVKTD